MFGNRYPILPVLACTFILVAQAQAAEIYVATPEEVRSALGQADPGDIIRVAPGVYDFFDAIDFDSAGTPEQPIQLIGDGAVSDVEFRIHSRLGLSITGQDYVVEGIWLRCQGSQCTSARGISLWGSARRISIRGCRTTNFLQHIKGWITNDTLDAPEDITIAGNEAYNTASFSAKSNVFNLNGGTRWRVIGNYVHDYGNTGTSYGIYLKGATTQSVIERNLVAGRYERTAGGGAAVGISFGGGRMGVKWCAEGNKGAGGCICEDYNGIARNNIVINTSDAALHVNSACGSRFLNNIVYNSAVSLRIQSFEGEGDIEARNNVLGGGLPGNSNLVSTNNIANADFAALYNNADGLDFSAGAGSDALAASAPLPGVVRDYCGVPRSNTPSRGAIEMPAACDVGERLPLGGVFTSASTVPNPPSNLTAD